MNSAEAYLRVSATRFLSGVTAIILCQACFGVIGCSRGGYSIHNNENLLRELNEKRVSEGLIIAEANMRWLGTVDYTTRSYSVRDDFSKIELMSTWPSSSGDEIVAMLAGGRGLTIIDTAGKEIWRASQYAAYAAGLSPDKKVLAFQDVDGVFAINLTSKELIEVDRRKAEKEGSRRFSSSLGWSPDKKKLVYSIEGNVLIKNLESGAVSKIAEGDDPTWSPDGVWIAYISPKQSGILSSVLGRAQRILANGRRILGPIRWSPDSRYVLYEEPDYYYGWTSRSFWFGAPAQLVVTRLADGADLTVLDLVSRGLGRWYGWLRQKREED